MIAPGTVGWVPAGIDVNRPCAARIHNAHLGGLHNFAADRWLAQREEEIQPRLPAILHAERAFLTRAIRFLIAAGVRQFLDLGSGLPTAGPVHEIADAARPGCRVVYVDVDPVAVAHGASMLAGNPNTAMVRADLRDVPIVLAAGPVRELIDFSWPVAVLMVSVLQFLTDTDDPAGVVARYRDAVPAGSYLVISHPPASRTAPADHLDDDPDGGPAAVGTLTGRTRPAIENMLAGWELAPPGLTPLQRWRPDQDGAPADDLGDLAPLATVARKA